MDAPTRETPQRLAVADEEGRIRYEVRVSGDDVVHRHFSASGQLLRIQRIGPRDGMDSWKVYVDGTNDKEWVGFFQSLRAKGSVEFGMSREGGAFSGVPQRGLMMRVDTSRDFRSTIKTYLDDENESVISTNAQSSVQWVKSEGNQAAFLAAKDAVSMRVVSDRVPRFEVGALGGAVGLVLTDKNRRAVFGTGIDDQSGKVTNVVRRTAAQTLWDGVSTVMTIKSLAELFESK